MHSLGEQDNFPDSNRTAGKYLNVHHNVFEIRDGPGISLSGVPKQYARFCNNWCIERDGMIDGDEGADLRVKNNVYGSSAVKQGRQKLKQFAANIPLSNGKPSLSAWTPPKKNQKGRATAPGGK